MAFPKDLISNVSISNISLSREKMGPPLIVGVLGLNLWIGLMGLPLWHLHNLGALSTLATVVAVAAFIPLLVGVWLLAASARGAAVALLIVVPLFLLAAIVIQPSLVGPSVFSPAVAAIVGVSFAAFVLGTCWGCHRAASRPLSFKARHQENGGEPRKLRLWPWLPIGFGALLAAQMLVQGHLTDLSFPSEELGPRDRWRAVILSTGALLIWSVAFFAILAPSLGRARLAPLAPASRGAAAIWLTVVILAFAMLLFSSFD